MSKWGVWATRSAASVFGAAEAWMKSDGAVLEYESEEEAAAAAEYFNDSNSSANVSYLAAEMENGTQ